MVVDQLADAVMGNQEIAPPQEAEQRTRAHRKDVLPRQPAPDLGQPLHAVERGIAGIEGAVQRADAGADHHVGGHAVRDQRLQHADLDRAKAAAAREHEGGLFRAGIVGHGHGFLPRRVANARRWGVYSRGTGRLR